MLPTRVVKITARQPHQLFVFYPELSGGADEILLKKRYSVTTGASGEATINLPIGHWTCACPTDFADGSEFEFDLVAGAEIGLEDLLVAGNIEQPQPVYDYVDSRLEDIAFDALPRYIHTQTSSATEWTVNHNLNAKPVAEVTDAGGSVVEAEVLHISPNQLKVYFSSARTGFVRCI